jgi:hypothetical protein
MTANDVPSAFDPAEMWPVYERVCRVVREAVTAATTPLDGARRVAEDELRGAVAMTATAVEVLAGVGNLLVRVDGRGLASQTLNAMLGQPPAYRTAPFMAARDWMAYWANHDRHWEVLGWMEKAIAGGTAVAVLAALIEICVWQNGLIALLVGRSAEDQVDEFLRHWRERG